MHSDIGTEQRINRVLPDILHPRHDSALYHCTAEMGDRQPFGRHEAATAADKISSVSIILLYLAV